MARGGLVAVALVLVAAACGGDAEPATDATAATSPSTAVPTVTISVPESTSSTDGATTSTTEAAGTTQAPLSSDPGVVLAEEKVARVEAVMPADYTVETTLDTDPEQDNTLFTACLSDGSFDLDRLDDFTIVAYDIDFDTPEVGVFGAASGSVEVRVFESEDVAAAAFATLEELLGTDAGRQCVGSELAAVMAADVGEEADVTVAVEPGPLLGDASARLVIGMTLSGFDAVLYFDLVASREGDCTVYAVFQAFDEPFEEEIANTLLFAAFGG